MLSCFERCIIGIFQDSATRESVASFQSALLVVPAAPEAKHQREFALVINKYLEAPPFNYENPYITLGHPKLVSVAGLQRRTSPKCYNSHIECRTSLQQSMKSTDKLVRIFAVNRPLSLYIHRVTHENHFQSDILYSNIRPWLIRRCGNFRHL